MVCAWKSDDTAPTRPAASPRTEPSLHETERRDVTADEKRDTVTRLLRRMRTSTCGQHEQGVLSGVCVCVV